MDKVVAKIQFEKYIIKNINFQLNPRYMSDSSKEVEIDISLNHKLALDLQGNKAELTLLCELSKDYEKTNRPFSVSMEIVGFFNYDINLEEDQRTLMLITNGSAILFPYLRAAIGMITMLSGVPSFVLPTINIAQLIKQAETSPKTSA